MFGCKSVESRLLWKWKKVKRERRSQIHPQTFIHRSYTYKQSNNREMKNIKKNSISWGKCTLQLDVRCVLKLYFCWHRQNVGEICQTQWKICAHNNNNTKISKQNGKYLTLCSVNKDNVIFRIPLGIRLRFAFEKWHPNDIRDFLRFLCIYLIKTFIKRQTPEFKYIYSQNEICLLDFVMNLLDIWI